MCDIKTGIELELWVVDDRGRLADGTGIARSSQKIKPEFVDPLVEVATDPHESERGLRHDLESTLREALQAADDENKHLVPLGTPLTASNAAVNCERGVLFERIFGPGVESAKNCAGTHIHFQQGNVSDQLNLLTALDPALALTSSSPYYCGQNGHLSSRAYAYRRRSGPEFRQYCDLWPYVDSVDEWIDRVAYVYAQFERLAAKRDVSPATVAEYFDPENTVLTPVRLRQTQPTVEWRAPDAALPSEVLDLAIDVGRVVAQADSKEIDFGRTGVFDDRIGLPRFPQLEALSHRAIRSGLDETAVEVYLRKFGFNPGKYDPIAPVMNGPPTISRSSARDRRLEQAHRLRTDLTAVVE